jgi:hypothetical protein
MILRAMLQRLYAALTSGPGLNARPHHSRQRVDVMELRHLRGDDPATLLARLLADGGQAVEMPARVPAFRRPEHPEGEWSDAQKESRAAHDRQGRILDKLRDIAEDATDYYNDHGEHALFVGFPLVSLPPVNDRQGTKTTRVLAPAMLVPVNLRVRRGANPGVTLELAGDGADLVQPNPALLAWIEQQTGVSTETLFNDESGEESWREIQEVLALTARAAGLKDTAVFDANTPLQPVPRTESLPEQPALLPCAVLGLFPLVNPGLLRDTKWMMESEVTLLNPVKAFLSTDALAEPDEAAPPPAMEFDHAQGSSTRTDFAGQLLVTHADPCQAEAVAHARRSAALVIHGPPGTGKSQTIANVIGDHLARGERVLFVCDKRTALDVVKYRLDSMGLGNFCGVIHDPQRDRRDFYLGLRERLENLAEEKPVPDPTRELALVNERLNTLHTELRGYFDCLHGRNAEEQSFHELCGEWLSLRTKAGVDLPEVEGVTVELLRQHRTDAEEILRRGLQARWPENPYRGRLGMSLAQWLGASAEKVRASLDPVAAAAAEVEQHAGDSLPALSPSLPAGEQAIARRELAARLQAVAQRGLVDVAARLAADTGRSRWRDELTRLSADGERFSRPLDRELFLQCQGAPPSLADCSRRILALEQWAAVAASWMRFFAFGKKKAAREALAPLALPLIPDAVERARQFHLGLKARHLWSDLRDRVLGVNSPALPGDDVLVSFRDGLPELLAVCETAELPANAAAKPQVAAALANLPSHAAPLIALLQCSARRAEAIAKLESALAATGLFTPSAVAGLSAGWRNNGPAEPLCRRFVEFADTLEAAIRLHDRLATLPAPLQAALDDAAERGLPWEDAEPALRAAALARELRQRLRDNEALARVDTQRVEAAFSELVQRTAEKSDLVRRGIQNTWQARWRERLLTGTGSRLNSLGAALRQRLFVRGQKAMKLRQMIAAGATASDPALSANENANAGSATVAPNGDPLFDLCPVWMAGPATVAQIFPRAALFDVIVFDEASQCRLEEALPVLLRGKRVVIAGDPKQLPPTRFFEQALAESDDVSAETAEEVFQQQQSEAEDLLTAALNLNVQEAFLDVHYRSRNEALIGFSNEAFYGSRLQPIPGHPRNKAAQTPIKLVRVDGAYQERGNEAEAKAAAALVAELLDDREPPSIGIACFNLNQRDLILDALEERAAVDAKFATRLEAARHRQGRDSFEGLFVKNLENVQGDERDHIIISTTFGPDAEGKFRRNFGALSRLGGERRLNVLVTRARAMIHVLTSIPHAEYASPEPLTPDQRPTGRHQLYAYLRYAERLERLFEEWQRGMETAKSGEAARCEIAPTTAPSPVAESLARRLCDKHGVGSTVYWGNDGFCVDVALTHPALPADVTLGLLTDFTRYARTPDPIAWEQFRSVVLAAQGWELQRLWSPALFRELDAATIRLRAQHEQCAARVIGKASGANMELDS